jgi:hypothetical protein
MYEVELIAGRRHFKKTFVRKEISLEAIWRDESDVTCESQTKLWISVNEVTSLSVGAKVDVQAEPIGLKATTVWYNGTIVASRNSGQLSNVGIRSIFGPKTSNNIIAPHPITGNDKVAEEVYDVELDLQSWALMEELQHQHKRLVSPIVRGSSTKHHLSHLRNTTMFNIPLRRVRLNEQDLSNRTQRRDFVSFFIKLFEEHDSPISAAVSVNADVLRKLCLGQLLNALSPMIVLW